MVLILPMRYFMKINSLEELYDDLIRTREIIKEMKEESYNKTKAFNYLYSYILNLIDELSYLEDNTDLLEDDFFNIKNKSNKLNKIKDESYKPKIDLSDLI